MRVDFSYIPAVFFSSRCLHNTLRDLFLPFCFCPFWQALLMFPFQDMLTGS